MNSRSATQQVDLKDGHKNDIVDDFSGFIIQQS